MKTSKLSITNKVLCYPTPKKHNLESMLKLNCYSQHQAFRRNCDQIFWSKCKISSWKWGDHLINNLHFYLLSNNVVCHQIWFDLKDAFEICTLFVKEPFIPYLEVYLDLWRLPETETIPGSRFCSIYTFQQSVEYTRALYSS